jgi:tripartite-type tricarboxylate transporter receptor subunit TctC
MNRRDILLCGFAPLVTTGFARPARAQAKYPVRPIKLIVPFPPGGVVDPIARQWAERVKRYLGTVVVENLGGGGGTIGTGEGARAQPDGYTAVLGLTGTMVLNPVILPSVPYDPVKDFKLVAILAISSNGIIVNPSIPAQTLAEFIAYAKANQGRMSYGSAGAGTITNLAGELFKRLISAPEIVHVPYKGAGPCITDLVSGQIAMATVGINGQLLQLHRAGKVRILAVTSAHRLKGAPEIPTTVEAGLPEMIADVFTTLMLPAKTPKRIVDQMSDASQQVMADPAMQQELIAQGLEPVVDSNPDQARDYLLHELERWTPLITALGLKQS